MKGPRGLKTADSSRCAHRGAAGSSAAAVASTRSASLERISTSLSAESGRGVGTGGKDTGRRARHGRADRRMPPNRRTRTNRALGPLEALEAPARETIAVGRRPHLERHCACAACLRASSGASQRHDACTFSCWVEEALRPWSDPDVRVRYHLGGVAHLGAVSSPSKARAVGRRARQRAPAHADEVRGWPQKPAGGARCHGPGRDELASCETSQWAYGTDGCVGPAAQRSGRPAGLCAAGGTRSRIKPTARLRPRTARPDGGIFIPTRFFLFTAAVRCVPSSVPLVFQ